MSRDPRWCSRASCPNPSEYVLTFNGWPGHLHNCTGCTAEVRRTADVRTVTQMPCTLPHGNVWLSDMPLRGGA